MADLQVNNLVFHMSKIQAELDETKRKLKQEKSEKERVLTRLSAIAGSKLTHNNPGIADLSDRNRPQKLGEYFSELYDNEWTEAVGELSEGRGETVAIELLRDVLKFIAVKTKSWAAKQYKSLQEALFQRDLRESEAGVFIVIYKKITELQKEVATLSISNAKRWLKEDEEFMTKYKDILSLGEPYIDRCVELCWMMQVQDPPMYLEFESPTVIDKNVFRLFTRNGRKLDFVVWPALLLHENGPLVHKGVVQPLKDDSAKTKERTI